jgi:hypothetical protein
MVLVKRVLLKNVKVLIAVTFFLKYLCSKRERSIGPLDCPVTLARLFLQYVRIWRFLLNDPRAALLPNSNLGQPQRWP